MQHEINKMSLTVDSLDLTFDDIYKKDYIPQDYLDEIKKANLLIIPTEHFRGMQEVVFPETTLDFYEYIKENSNDDITADIAISDGKFLKMELHSAVITVATIIVQYVVLPIATGLISSFLYELVKKHHRKNEETSAEVNIIVEETKSKKTKKITYKGPISGIKQTLDNISDKLFDDEEDNT